MPIWDHITSLKSFIEFNTTPLLFLLLLAIISFSLFNHLTYPDLPGPSFLHNFPKGEVYPILNDSRTSLRTLTKLHQNYGNIFQLWLGPHLTVLSANPADIAQIMSSDDFARPAGMRAMFQTIVPGGLFTMPKEIHIATRKKLKHNFNFPMVENCHAYLTDAVSELCDELSTLARKPEGKADHVDISPILANATFRVIVNLAFGSNMPKEERAKFYLWVEDLIDEMLKDVLGYPIRQAFTPFGLRQGLFTARDKIYTICKTFIARRRAETSSDKSARPSDALDAILALGNDDATVLSQTIEFAIAGSHTTSNALAWCIYEICRNPKVEAAVCRELEERLKGKPLSEVLTSDDVKSLCYLRKVWKENLRLHPAGGFFMRETNKEVVLSGSGVTLPRGANVIAFLHGSQNSAEIWRDPQKFVPERWGDGTERGEGDRVPVGAYMPFSMGERNCIGMFLADHEGVLVLAELYRRFRFRLACDPAKVVTCTSWVESPKFLDGDMGVPVEIEMRT